MCDIRAQPPATLHNPRSIHLAFPLHCNWEPEYVPQETTLWRMRGEGYEVAFVKRDAVFVCLDSNN